MFGDLGVCKGIIVYTCLLSLLYSSCKISVESLCYINEQTFWRQRSWLSILKLDFHNLGLLYWKLWLFHSRIKKYYFTSEKSISAVYCLVTCLVFFNIYQHIRILNEKADIQLEGKLTCVRTSHWARCKDQVTELNCHLIKRGRQLFFQKKTLVLIVCFVVCFVLFHDCGVGQTPNN